ncbi:MAG: alpha/beta hydrolase [Alphaproteobacteria bacterium]|nr:alpha/beta hydrolase [Alphaproteobacteria bacterium]
MVERTPVFFELTGRDPEKAPCLVVWAHGWGHNRNVFKPLAEALSQRAAHMLVDFPGFGQAAMPPSDWGTEQYADALAEAIRPFRSIEKIVYVGHSFGCRVGLQIAAKYPELIDGLFFVSAAGLRRRRSLVNRIYVGSRILVFKALKHVVLALHGNIDALRAKFGSPDYKSAGALRPIFMRVIAEDLSEKARAVRCPAYLLYGENDVDTPPEIGARLNKLIPGSRFFILPGQDHLSVLSDGKHIVVKRLSEFMDSLK